MHQNSKRSQPLANSTGQTVLVAGGTKGLGKAIGLAFGRQGAVQEYLQRRG